MPFSDKLEKVGEWAADAFLVLYAAAVVGMLGLAVIGFRCLVSH